MTPLKWKKLEEETIGRRDGKADYHILKEQEKSNRLDCNIIIELHKPVVG